MVFHNFKLMNIRLRYTLGNVDKVAKLRFLWFQFLTVARILGLLLRLRWRSLSLSGCCTKSVRCTPRCDPMPSAWCCAPSANPETGFCAENPRRTIGVLWGTWIFGAGCCGPTRSACSPPKLSMSLLSSGRCSTPEPCVCNRTLRARFVPRGWCFKWDPVSGGW